MKSFGGNWTDRKIEILVEYAKAYLKIMNKYPFWELIYFDGFAGSGLIKKKFEDQIETIHGATIRILEIENPKPFDLYYFVEKDNNIYSELIQNTKNKYPKKRIHSVKEDCNIKLLDLSLYLKSDKGTKSKVLAYIDPFGMQIDWESIRNLKSTSVDLWILVPTGLGINRLLKKNGEISSAWYNKLEKFLGLKRNEIDKHFYQEKSELTLFGEDFHKIKEEDAILKAGELYKKRLAEVFQFVSIPYLLRNSQNAVMFHFFLASNNSNAVKIANDIINKYDKLT